MKWAVLVVALGACGRIGFDPTRGDGGPTDGDVPFVDPVGMLDPDFGVGGQTIVVRGSEDSKIFDVRARNGGYFSFGRVQSGVSRAELLAWTPDGRLDAAFSRDGIEEYTLEGGEYGYGVLPLSDGRFFLAGDGFRSTPGNDDMLFGIIDASGAIDPSFAAGLTYLDIALDDTAYRAVETSRGVVACGVTQRGVGDTHHVLLALRFTGMRDDSFGVGGLVVDDVGGGGDFCYDIVVDGAGQLVTAGTSGTDQIVTRYDAVGGRDPSFATAGRHTVATMNGEGRAIAIAPDGDLVIAGYGAGGGYITRLSPGGVVRSAFGQNGTAKLSLGLAPTTSGVALYDVAVQPNGKIIAVGSRQAIIGDLDGVIVRLLPDGTLDPTFGTGGMIVLDLGPDDTFNAVHVESGGVIAVGSTAPAGVAHAWIVRLR